jgi:hypothetical protein
MQVFKCRRESGCQLREREGERDRGLHAELFMFGIARGSHLPTECLRTAARHEVVSQKHLRLALLKSIHVLLSGSGAESERRTPGAVVPRISPPVTSYPYARFSARRAGVKTCVLSPAGATLVIAG